MPKSMHLAVASLALFVAVPSVAYAGSIKDQVSDSALAAYCSETGVGSETMASIKLSDGTKLTGSIHCEQQDLIVGDVTSNGGDDKVDDVGDGNDDGNDDVNDDVNDDDDGGSGSGSDDEGDGSGSGSDDEDGGAGSGAGDEDGGSGSGAGDEAGGSGDQGADFQQQ